ncbi:ATP-dependent zinc protease [Thaumasiovibrio subtropicus]|uniref:ATP-dependent zinc protease family protein n=1 Tax=Thaumasiovibrio subtropicus TaxID=1891207 RepID=UPI000B355260|nr:ATP-dependent zinc protease [Thaumasiovibrio subtropicus]
MIRRSLPILTLAFLSGCVMTQKDHDLARQETINSLEQIETKLNTQIDDLNQRIESQSELLSQLEQQIATLGYSLDRTNLLISKVAHSADGQSLRKPEPQAPSSPTVDSDAGQKTLLGAQEWVWLDMVDSYFRARVDTGATTSSLNATNIQQFEREGKTWVRFNLAHTADDQAGKEELVEARVIRWVKIRQSNSEDADRRPVIEAWVRIGDLRERTQFTLADRTQMEFPVLLGREFFQDIAVVDVGRTYVQGKPTKTEK